jgi:hypothetical protein
MVLSDWKRHCPIVRSFVTLLTEITGQYDEGRSRIARGILFNEKGQVGADTKKGWEGHVDVMGRRLKTRAFLAQLKSAWAGNYRDDMSTGSIRGLEVFERPRVFRCVGRANANTVREATRANAVVPRDYVDE